MNKSVLLAGGAFIAVFLTALILLYTANVEEIQTTTLETQELKVVKSAHEVNQLQLADGTKGKSEKASAKGKSEEKTSNSESSKKDKKNKNLKTKAKNKQGKNKSKKKSQYKYEGQFKVTAYCRCSACCGKSTGITASGTRATAGRTIAADASKFPFGTQLKIDGHVYTVEDRGGAINGNKIDVYFDSHSAALQWGVRYCEVYMKR